MLSFVYIFVILTGGIKIKPTVYFYDGWFWFRRSRNGETRDQMNIKRNYPKRKTTLELTQTTGVLFIILSNIDSITTVCINK